MNNNTNQLNPEVTQFLDGLDHPFRNEIEQLRQIILSGAGGLSENVKWNGPNYCFANEDRITMKIHPPKQVQLIFHRGAKKLAQLKEKLIEDRTGLLAWRENDRAIASFKTRVEIEHAKNQLQDIVRKWIDATK